MTAYILFFTDLNSKHIQLFTNFTSYIIRIFAYTGSKYYIFKPSQIHVKCSDIMDDPIYKYIYSKLSPSVASLRSFLYIAKITAYTGYTEQTSFFPKALSYLLITQPFMVKKSMSSP